MTPFWAKMTLFGQFQVNEQDRRKGLSHECAQYFEELITEYEVCVCENSMNNTSNTVIAKTMEKVLMNIYKSCACDPQKIDRGREFAEYIRKIRYFDYSIGRDGDQTIYLDKLLGLECPIGLYKYDLRPDLFVDTYIKDSSSEDIFTIKAYLGPYGKNSRKIVRAIDDYMETRENEKKISK